MVAPSKPDTSVLPVVADSVAAPGVAPTPATLKVKGVLKTPWPLAFLAVRVKVAVGAVPGIRDVVFVAMVIVEPLIWTGICAGVIPVTVAVTVAMRLLGSAVPEERITVALPKASVCTAEAVD